MPTLHTLPAPTPAAPEPDCQPDPAGLDVDTLAGRLVDGARGDTGTQAAVGLLVAHDQWLRDRCFLQACCWAGTDAQSDLPFVWVDWAAAAGYAQRAESSAAGRAVLTVAAGIAGHPSETPLRDMFAALDSHAARLVLQALCHLGDLDAEPHMVWCEPCGSSIPAAAADHTHPALAASGLRVVA